jgi:undecaprenyl-diphosphatase
MKKILNKNNTKNILLDVNIPTYIISLIIFLVSFLLDKVIILFIDNIQYPLLLTIFYLITLFGEMYIFAWIALILLAVLIINQRKFLALGLTVIIDPLMIYILKTLINRPRPFEALNINSSIQTSMSSFPSGHTMMFFSIIPVMSKNFPKIKWIFWTFAILVGFSRIYLGVHYLSDVIGGAIIGYSIGWIFLKIGEKYAWKY